MRDRSFFESFIHWEIVSGISGRQVVGKFCFFSRINFSSPEKKKKKVNL